MDLITVEWKCFIEIARTGSLSKAASALRLPQPSVTKYLQRLERNLDVRLFQRSNRGVKLTQTGELLFRNLSHAQAQLSEKVHQALQQQEEVSGRVQLGAHRILALNYLPPVISSLYNKYPALSMDLTFATSLEISRMVASGNLDYGFVANPLPLNGLVIHSCLEEDVGLFTSSKISLSSLKRVFYNPEMQLLNRILRKLRHCSLESIADYEVLAELSGRMAQSAALLPRPIAHRYKLNHQISPNYYRAKIALIFRSEIQRSTRHRAIIEMFNQLR